MVFSRQNILSMEVHWFILVDTWKACVTFNPYCA
jgi:hypothetical protein